MKNSNELSPDWNRAAEIVRDIYRKSEVDATDHKLTACMAFIRLFQAHRGFDRDAFFKQCGILE